MNFRQLLQRRTLLLRQARLANLAFAHARLALYAHRLAAAVVDGPLTLHPVDPSAGRYCPVLVAHASSQAVIDEYFLDEDVADLADVLAFLEAEGFAVEWTFSREEISHRWLPRLRHELEVAGVVPPPTKPIEEGYSPGPGPDLDSREGC
jgi:hypothetical protein